MKNLSLLLLLITFTFQISYSQQPSTAAIYPKTVMYTCILHPVLTIDENGTTYNFKGSYTVGVPFGINILRSDRIGFSFELVPVIKMEYGVSKVSNLIFHPGIMLRYKHGFTFITRLAFETGGRYGITPVFNKVLLRKKNSVLFAAIPLPLRFGNDKPVSAGLGFQVGVGF